MMMVRQLCSRLSQSPIKNPRKNVKARLELQLWRRFSGQQQQQGEVLSAADVLRSARGVAEELVYAARKRALFSDTEAINQVCSILRRWGWGPSSVRELDSLPFHPTAFHIAETIKSLRDLPTIISLFSWSRSKPWYVPNPVVFTMLIDRFGSVGDFHTMDWLLHTMKQDRCDLNSVTYHTLIKCYARASKLDQAHAYFMEMRQFGFQIDIHHINVLIDSFCKAGLHQKALEIFEQIQPSGCTPDERTYKLLPPALAKAGNLDEACRLYFEMTAKGHHPDLPSYYSLINALAKAGRFETMMQLYRNMNTEGLPPNPPIYATIIESFAKAGKIEMAMNVFIDSRNAGYKPFASTFSTLIEAHIKAMQLDGAVQLHDNMVESGCMPNLSLVSDLIKSLVSIKELAKAKKLFNSMIAARHLPNPKVCSALVEGHMEGGDFEAAIKLYQSIQHTYEHFLREAKETNLSDRILRTSQEMTEFKYSVDLTINNYSMKALQNGGVQAGGRCFQLMIEAGVQVNPKISSHLMEDCLKLGFYDMSKQALDQFLKSGCSPNLHMYCVILSSFTRCSVRRQDGILASITKQEKVLMSMLSSTGHQAHKFLCSMWSGPQRRKEAPLDLVRSFFQRLETEADVQLTRWFTSVLLNYLVLMGQIKRARCVWKVAYEKKVFPGRILFDRDAVWTVDVRTLSIGAALTAVVHTLHRFRKRMMDYDSIPRRIKIVTGFNLRGPVVDMLQPLGSPFETSGGCLRSRGQYVAEWFKQPFVEKFLENELPSSDEILLQRLKMTFPQPAQEPYMLIMNASMAK